MPPLPQGDLGAILRPARHGDAARDLGHQPEALAEAVGISRITQLRIERCRAVPRMETLNRLLTALDLKTADVAVRGHGTIATLLSADIPHADRELDLGANLRHRRRKFSLSIAVAAVAAGVSASQLSHIERGQSRHSRWFAWHSDDPDLHEDDRGRVYVHPVLDDFRRGRCDADVRGPSTWVCNLPVQRLKHIGPGIRIVLELIEKRTRSRLDEGRIGLFVTAQKFALPRHPVALLFAERQVVAGCADKPALAERRIKKADFLALDNVAVLLGTNVPAAFADRQLEEIGKVRQIGVTVPSFAAVLWMVVGTRRIALMHDGWPAQCGRACRSCWYPCPLFFPKWPR